MHVLYIFQPSNSVSSLLCPDLMTVSQRWAGYVRVQTLLTHMQVQ